MNKIVLVPDSFKGTMSSQEICCIMKKEIMRPMGSLWHILRWVLHSVWRDCSQILSVLRHGTVRSVAFCTAEL